jgi:hypothetical protein
MPVLRGKLLAALPEALDAGRLRLPAGVTLPQLRRLLNRLGRQHWHVQIMERSAQGRGVATYLARYRRGGPLKPGRLVAWDAQRVTFRYADTQDPEAQGRGKRKLLPSLSGSPRPSARPRQLLLPLLRSQFAPALSLQSP